MNLRGDNFQFRIPTLQALSRLGQIENRETLYSFLLHHLDIYFCYFWKQLLRTYYFCGVGRNCTFTASMYNAFFIDSFPTEILQRNILRTKDCISITLKKKILLFTLFLFI